MRFEAIQELGHWRRAVQLNSLLVLFSRQCRESRDLYLGTWVILLSALTKRMEPCINWPSTVLASQQRDLRGVVGRCRSLFFISFRLNRWLHAPKSFPPLAVYCSLRVVGSISIDIDRELQDLDAFLFTIRVHLFYAVESIETQITDGWTDHLSIGSFFFFFFFFVRF